MPVPPFDLAAALDAFLAQHPERGADVQRFKAFLAAHPCAFDRSHAHGHFTGSAWLVDASGRHALLTLHAKLGRWLQPGGHADGDPDLAAVALREATEESGLDELLVEPAIFDLDRHRIPARDGEPEHWHYDVRFVVRALGSTRFRISAESADLAWRKVSELAEDPDLDPSLRRMARMWLRME
ncbi:MAG: NUDIX hydrolase [Lysobacteraceae bacterium]|nr:MAG: NUDIX hydrolase [Xanthomonadaceae bacterium]